MTDAAALNMDSLSPPARANLLRSYFSRDGLEYNVIRIPIASSDFSTRNYSYADEPGDFALSSFALSDEDLSHKVLVRSASHLAYSSQIPLVKEALKLSERKMKLFASPWSAPAWLKTSNSMIGNGTLNGEPGSPPYKTWANYFVKCVPTAHSIPTPPPPLGFWTRTPSRT